MTPRVHRIVFLYSELAGYFLACAEALGKHWDVASVDIVHWPVQFGGAFPNSHQRTTTRFTQGEFQQRELEQTFGQDSSHRHCVLRMDGFRLQCHCQIVSEAHTRGAHP